MVDSEKEASEFKTCTSVKDNTGPLGACGVAGAWYWRNNQELLPVTINHHHCTLHAQFDPLFGAVFFAANKCIALGIFFVPVLWGRLF